MKNKNRPSLAAACLAVAPVLVSLGCAAPPPARDDSMNASDVRQKVLKTLPPPPQPPAAPPPVASTLDPALREKAKAEILAAARSGDPVLRANAMEAAQNGLGREGAEVVLAGLKDQEPLVRFAASMAAGALRLEAARPLLLGLVDDRNETVQVGSRFALHRLGDYRRSHDLEKLATSTTPRVRATTVLALGLLGEKSALNILRPMQGDYDPAVRLQVAEAMWRLGDEKGMETLVSAVVSQAPDDQIIGAQGLASTNDARVAPYLRGKLTTVYDEVNLAAARALGMVGSDDGYGVALKGAKSNDPRQRHMAALAFGAIGRPDAQPVLADLLQDRQQNVRLAAAMALLQLKE